MINANAAPAAVQEPFALLTENAFQGVRRRALHRGGATIPARAAR
jgi:hypothetical protein